MRQKHELTGQRFGLLVVIEGCEPQIMPSGQRLSRWLCKCDCGTSRKVLTQNLVRGMQQSCGCNRSAAVAKARTTHGQSGTKTYHTWSHMKRRCYDTGDKSYPDYGARGVTVCKRWRDSYAAFIADVGQPPASDSMLDRINNHGNYEPGNVRWATRTEQNNNTRKNVFVTFRGETKTISQWAARHGFRMQVLWDRLQRYKWSVERAMTTPVKTAPRSCKRPYK